MRIESTKVAVRTEMVADSSNSASWPSKARRDAPGAPQNGSKPAAHGLHPVD